MGDKVIETTNVIWAAGNKVNGPTKTLDVPLDRAGRVIVNPDLSIPGHPNIFVIGDAAHFEGPNGIPLPGLAPVAMQQGKYIGKMIRENIPPENRKPFVYRDKGTMATIGRAKAVAVMGKRKFSGFFAWMSWSFIHILYLISFSNKFLVMMQWMFWYFTGQRNARLITKPPRKE